MPAAKPVTKSDLHPKIAPITDPTPLTQLPDCMWSEEEWQRIRLSYASRDMDEKWDIYAEENVVFLHRSWTGCGVYEVTFTHTDGGWRIASAIREAALDRPGVNNDEYHCVLLNLVLGGIALRKPPIELRARLVQLMRSGSKGDTRQD